MTALPEIRAAEIAGELSPSNFCEADIFVLSREALHAICEQYHREAGRVDADPFGYFRALPFGWENCAETDEGAIALYERQGPQIAALQERIAELELNAMRYRVVRRGQLWSVVNGIGDALRADELDAAIDAAIERGIDAALKANREGGE